MEIHILLAGEQFGPFSETQVRQYLGEGLVSPSDLAMCEGVENWHSVDELLARLPPSGPETISPSQPHSVAPPAPDPAQLPPRTMPNNASETLEPPSSPPQTGMLPSLHISQKTKRKLNKIVIQPILPLQATAPLPKKTKSGKTALTLEPLRPTTSLPPITGPLPREKKPGRNLIRTGQLSFGDLSEKKAAAPTAPMTPVPAPVPPETLSKVSQPPEPLPSQPLPQAAPLPPEPADETPAPEASLQRLRSAIYTVAAQSLLVICVFFAVIYFLFGRNLPPTDTGNPKPANPAPPAKQVDTLSPEFVPQTAANYHDRGMARQAKGDLNGAILDYNQAVELDPRNVDAFYRRGLAHQAQGNLNGALEDYTQVISLDPKQADAFSNRGFVKQAQGDLDGALADYTKALQLNPRISVAFYNEGLIDVQKGDLDGAIIAYNHALDLDPKMAIAYYNRGNAKNTEGNLDGAIADYTQAIVLNPTIALAYCNRGFARQSKGDSDGALTDYAQALALNPKLAVALYNRGLIKVQKGDLDGAIADSSQAIDLDPKNGQAYCNRGLARLGKGYLDDAQADLREFIQLAPRDSGADSARLYMWLIATEENPKGTADQDLSTSLLNDWNSTPEDLSSKIAAFLLGHINENDLIADAASPDPSREPGQYCKVWYFAGMKRLLSGDTATAVTDFQKSVATQQKDYCEYIFAQAELRRLGPSLPISSKP